MHRQRTKARGHRSGWMLVVLTCLLACSSPNRGHWRGTFSGSVAGVVEFEINARGTSIEGKMIGQTRNGEDFRATLEGTLRQDFIKADFEGTSQGGAGFPLRFKGQMTGSLDAGVGQGDWTAELVSLGGGGARFKGRWDVEQVEN